MKFFRYLLNKEIKIGCFEHEKKFEIKGDLFNNYEITNIEIDNSQIKILAPVNPLKIIALAYNYKDLVGNKKKYDEPLIFIKPATSVIGTNDTIVIPEKNKVWTEVELGIVIKQKCKNVSIKKAKDYIFGYTIANDVTMLNILKRDHHLLRSKGCDTFCPLGPYIETELDTSNLEMTNSINEKLHQKTNTSNRILNDEETISLVSKFITLYPGDVIITGTGKGAESSIIKKGDIVSLKIKGLGELRNFVEAKK